MAPDEPAPPAQEPLLRGLLEAMRDVAERTRQSSLTAAREEAERAIQDAQTHTTTAGTELRERAAADMESARAELAAEIEKLRADGEQRLVARQARLAREEAALRSADEFDVAQVRQRLTDYEHSLASFFTELEGVVDPAAFVSIAQRLPPAPRFGTGLASPPPAAMVPQATPPDQVLVPSVVGPMPVEEPGAEVASIAPAVLATTAVAVAGHDSFGAITALKQALAGIDGVRDVRLGLAEGGEFVLTARHDPQIDVRVALEALDLPAAISGENSHLRVALGGPA